MQSLKSKIFLLIILVSTNIGAQTDSTRILINAIEFAGNKNLEKVALLNALNLDFAPEYSIDQIRQALPRILENYQAQGYFLCKIDSIIILSNKIENSSQVRIFVSEGPVFEIDALNFNGLTESEKQAWRQRFDSHPGKPFQPEILADDIEQGLQLAENNGFPFAEVRFDSLALTASETEKQPISIGLRVENGLQARIEEVTVRGNTITKSHVIRREARIRTGEIYRHQKISRIPRRLMRLGFLKSVAPPQLYLKDDGRTGLLITVEEGRANQFDGVAGYTPGTVTNKGYFTGLLNLSLGNLMGTGRKVNAYWQKKDRDSQALEFGYREPWVLGFPVHAGFEFEQLIQDSTYVQRGWSFLLELPVSENLTAGVKFGRQTVLPDSIGFVDFNIPKSSSMLLNFSITYDTRDDLLNPRSGLLYSTAVEVARKRNLTATPAEPDLPTDENIDQKKIWLDAEIYWPLFQRQVISTSLHGRQITSTEPVLTLPEQFRLGGSQTLRGYREEQFRGTKVAWVNLEYRFLLSRRSRVFAFLDYGYFSRIDEEDVLVRGSKIGYGFGMRLETRLGIMGVDYGLGESSGLLGGLIHVGVVNEF